MSRRNREKRAAKARVRAKERATASAGERRSSSPPLDVGDVMELLALAGQRRGGAHAWEAMRVLHAVPDDVFDAAAEGALLQQVAAMWRNGWQPAELHRQAKRGRDAPAGRLVALAIAHDHASRRSTTMDSRWIAQVEALRLPPTDGRRGWAARWRHEEGFIGVGAVLSVLAALEVIGRLPRLEELLPPPGSTAQQTVVAPSVAEADPMLARIRALLAKAESTSFEAEAETFTAKAYELMARHAIDAAVVYSQATSKDQPVTVRVPVDPPYADAKSLLLQTVARHGRCRAVMLGGLDIEQLMGFADDVAATEVLFTSLLVQAQHALAEAAKKAPPGTRVRSQAYRSSFLLAYARRIDERLEKINADVVETVAAEQGPGFLPALRSRQRAVDDLVAERCGTLTSSPVRGGHDGAGWAGGLAAADRAKLNRGDISARAAS